MSKWEAQIPKTPRNKDRKRCYVYWKHIGRFLIAGGKVVWLTDRERTLAYLKHPRIELREVLERDKLEEYKKYLDQTIE